MSLTKHNIDKMLLELSEKRFIDGNCSLLEELKLYILKEKCIYHHLN